ncbi:hypothetical protein HDU78_010644, partial [Chytriomyces hyalinus]
MRNYLVQHQWHNWQNWMLQSKGQQQSPLQPEAWKQLACVKGLPPCGRNQATDSGALTGIPYVYIWQEAGILSHCRMFAPQEAPVVAAEAGAPSSTETADMPKESPTEAKNQAADVGSSTGIPHAYIRQE